MAKLEEANEILQGEIEKRKTAEAQLRQLHAETESKVEQRTVELTREIQEREQIEQKIRDGERFLYNVFDSVQDGISVIDKDMNIVKTNLAMEKWYSHGVPLFGKKCYQAYYGRNEPCDNCPSRQALETGKPACGVSPRHNSDGQIVGWFDLYSFPMRNVASGEVTGVIEYVRDISARKGTEETLLESKQRLDTILDAILTGVFIIDAQTHCIVDINPVAADMVGLPKEQIIGKVCHKFICPAEQGKCPISDLGQKVDRSERFLLTADGGKVPVLKTVTSASWGGRQYFIESFVDISELKKAQTKQTELVQQLESVNKELKDFAYIVSHDLKAPLRGIKTLASWIATDYADKLDQQGKEQIQLLLGRVDRMQNLIDGVLQYSRLGRVTEEVIPVNIGELLPEIIDMVSAPPHITVIVENEMPIVQCGKTRISQVFQNLISNAIKYMDKPQGRVKVGSSEEAGFWKFYVADNGPGIEERFFEKVFKLFQTLSPHDETQSTGVGLAIAKKIVEMYGGKIWIESKVGQGSTFFFTLPKKQEKVQEEKLQTSIVN
jgi:PAS domain S-box-containing protein